MSRTVNCAGCGALMPDADPRRKWCSARCRQAQYGRPCVDCGRMTSGNNGAAKAPERCAPCGTAHRLVTNPPHWTRERILTAIISWSEQTGSAPRVTDWRHATDEYPLAMTVVRRFGSWNAAVAAAGLTTRRFGGNRRAAA